MKNHRTSPQRLTGILVALVLLIATTHADPLFITELVTDPQADHGESAGGNGTLFDLIPGSGAITTSDEFIELQNRGMIVLDLTGYTLGFFDSSPASYIFGTTTTGTLRFSPGSSLTALQPGAFVLLGNPPGSMNNTIGIGLTDASGNLLDSWSVVGDVTGDATGAEDEALVRAPNGEFYAHAAITPLAETPLPAPTPEPGTLWLVALSAAGALAAKRRRARCATGRTPSRSPDRCANRPAAHAGRPEVLDRRCGSQENA